MITFENNLFFLLVWTILWHLRIEKEKIYSFWESLREQLKKAKTQNTFCWSQSKYFHTDMWKISLENMEDKTLGFQFVLVSAKPTHPSYKDGSDQDEPQ